MWADPEVQTLAAIRFADRHITHGELHTESSRLANGLLAQMRG